MITSKQNERVRHARATRAGREPELIFIEGLRLCEEAAQANDLIIIEAFHTERIERDARGRALLDLIAHRTVHSALVNDEVFASMSDTKSPPGIALIAVRPPSDFETFNAQIKTQNPLIVALNQVNNPANAGSIMRAAEAAGASGIIATAHTVNLFSPKTLRGAMGASFRLPCWTNATFSELSQFCRHRNFRTVMLDARASASYLELDWTLPRVVIVGAEAHGFDAGELLTANDVVSIPMIAPVESLNVAVALGIVLYEARRQRSELNIEHQSPAK
ncbi:MAG: RNA methyltransferase [Pyrinomonadaceae bacterium MAG19_C2-C3]|nr:RNA methyltransferase [Pyrinomonadaceae bacterium MAG19_C2-C3]